MGVAGQDVDGEAERKDCTHKVSKEEKDSTRNWVEAILSESGCGLPCPERHWVRLNSAVMGEAAQQRQFQDCVTSRLWLCHEMLGNVPSGKDHPC